MNIYLKFDFLFLKPENTKCNTIQTFKNQLKADSDIIFKGNQIIVKKYTASFSLSTGLVSDNSNERYFLLNVVKSLAIKNQEKGIEELNLIKEKILNVITSSGLAFQIYPLSDDISFFYSKLSYPLINEVENLMRQLIYRFMITNLGSQWYSKGSPDNFNSLLKNKHSTKDKDEANIDYKSSFETLLHNVDFIQINKFLFTEYTINQRDVFEKIKKAKKLSEITLADIKELVPKDNWSRYFVKIIKIPKFQQNWESLYSLRCLIAHNNFINKVQYEEIVNLCDLFSKQIKNAINEIDKIKITESDKVELSHSAVSSFVEVDYPNIFKISSDGSKYQNLISGGRGLGLYSANNVLYSGSGLLSGLLGKELYSTNLVTNFYGNKLCSKCNKEFTPNLYELNPLPLVCNECRSKSPVIISPK
jgi:hypothetical protein